MDIKDLYWDPTKMWPLFPEDKSGELEDLATVFFGKARGLSHSIHPITKKALADFFRPMNSYYSNKIEGHDTHPIDIAKALNNNLSDDDKKRDLQLEAHAHIKLHEEIAKEIRLTPSLIPTSTQYIKSIHKRFYQHLPDEFKQSPWKDGTVKCVIPGEFRADEVEVGRHVGPYSKKVPIFMDNFQDFYNPKSSDNKSRIKRIISIAAAHHRLAWIHPFLDGNGRVIRLVSDASFISEKIDADGLWSISRGLSRNSDEYKRMLASADRLKINNYDGRGNLSNKYLEEFCRFFLMTAIDQVEFMSKMLNTDAIQNNIREFVDHMVIKKILKPESVHILIDVFLKGKINKADAMRITNTSDKTLKAMVDKLIVRGLLRSGKEGKTMFYYANFSLEYSPWFFPKTYPSNTEIELMKNLE